MLLLLLSVGIVCLMRSEGITLSSLFRKDSDSSQRIGQAFPGRGKLLEWNTSLNGLYKVSFPSDKNRVQLMIPIANDAADHGMTLREKETEASTRETEISITEEEQTPSVETEIPETEPTTTQEPTEALPEPKVEALGQMLLVGDRALELPDPDYEVIGKYASVLTELAGALPDCRVYSLLVPNAAGLYAPEDYCKGDASQKKMIDYAYYRMGESVHTVDAYSRLLEHKEEELYFRTDHHWTHLGSYYAYEAFCEEAGWEAAPLSSFEQGKYESFLGSMYGFLSAYPQREILRENPDSLVYYIPSVENRASYYENGSLSYAGSIQTIYPVPESVSNKYLCFLGGDHPVTIIETDLENGPVCLLIKESYGNAFSTWLTGHYSKIVCVDPREFNRDGKPSLDLIAFAQRLEIDDCIVLNYPLMLNSGAYTAWLQRLVT